MPISTRSGQCDVATKFVFNSGGGGKESHAWVIPPYLLPPTPPFLAMPLQWQYDIVDKAINMYYLAFHEKEIFRIQQK
jgi:hypothetical protein